MGWFARMFSSSESARIERAQLFLERKRYNDARLELEGIEGTPVSYTHLPLPTSGLV